MRSPSDEICQCQPRRKLIRVGQLHQSNLICLVRYVLRPRVQKLMMPLSHTHHVVPLPAALTESGHPPIWIDRRLAVALSSPPRLQTPTLIHDPTCCHCIEIHTTPFFFSSSAPSKCLPIQLTFFTRPGCPLKSPQKSFQELKDVECE
jgi:hypothetical protein